jgi:hypothetical protein
MYYNPYSFSAPLSFSSRQILYIAREESKKELGQLPKKYKSKTAGNNIRL